MNDKFELVGESLRPSEIRTALLRDDTAFDAWLADEIYANHDPDFIKAQKERFLSTIDLHAEKVGEKPTWLLRAPGRLNAFLEYLDMCAGDHMSTTIDGDILVAVSVRDDDKIVCSNSNPLFAPAELSITHELKVFKSAPWEGGSAAGLPDNWDNRTRIYPYHGRTRGDWLNYVRSSFLRVAWELPDKILRGVDMTFGPSTAPFRAGTSSSSAVVVLSFLALYLANRDILPPWTIQDICRLLGEAEWYVGTHGGANDQTTILRNIPNGVLYNRHSRPVLDSTPLPCLKGVRVVLANSLWEANKALGANYNFNLRKGWMDLGDDLLKLVIRDAERYVFDGGDTEPGWLARLLYEYYGFCPESRLTVLETDLALWMTISERYHKFGSLAEDLLGVPDGAIEDLISVLPDNITVEEAGSILGKDEVAMQRDYTLPVHPDTGYRVRNAATFFHRENRLGRALEKTFLEADDALKSGRLSADSHVYRDYQTAVGRMLNELQDTLRDDFQVSNHQLDLLLSIAAHGPGYLGGKLTGAGSGGCVSILVRDGEEDDFCRYLDREYYSKPEHFDRYRETLDSIEKTEPEAAREMKANLENALENISDQRRAITFSRGACAIQF